jgi:predicted DNA-binding transcriptional regulator AlpA
MLGAVFDFVADLQRDGVRSMAIQSNLPNHPLQMLSRRDLAGLLGVNAWSIDRWRKTDPDFPAPIWISAATPRWRRVDVERWIATRQRGGTAPDWRGKRREATNG